MSDSEVKQTAKKESEAKEKKERQKKKRQKKVKVEYDVGRKPEKRQRANRGGSGKLGKGNLIAIIILLVIEALFYYFVTPALNIHTVGFWIWMIFTFAALSVCTSDFSANKLYVGNGIHIRDVSSASTGITKYMRIAVLLCVVVEIVGGISSSKLLMASKYANVIQVTDGDFSVDVPESENISNIALMDTDSAQIIGARAIGSLSDVVSQYEVSQNYSTIDYNGVPMKVASLEYAGFFKYMNNKKTGIPGYVLVDPVKNEAKYVSLQKPIMYTPSAYFNHNLQRHVQLTYPTYDFNGYYFELDNEGNPYYICPVLAPNAGLFGAKDVKGIVICDPCTGDCEYKSVSEIPNWVDRVYDGDLACDKYNWYGMLSGGFMNSIIGNKGCKVTTDDYGYKVMDGDVWVYTGVTSVNGDESNIGFVLMNSRTAESKYFPIAGAEEYSAMSSAEGQVQNLGYTASFPSLINISDVPTYIMVLKDNAGLVKMYALVNVEKYSIVATGVTQKEALAGYRKLLVENEVITNDKTVAEDTSSKRITVQDIKYIALEGETYVYITDTTGGVYKQSFAEDETLILIQQGDKITVYYMEEENGINTLLSHE